MAKLISSGELSKMTHTSQKMKAQLLEHFSTKNFFNDTQVKLLITFCYLSQTPWIVLRLSQHFKKISTQPILRIFMK